MSALGSLVVKLALEYAEYTKGLDKSSQESLKFAQNTQNHFKTAASSSKEFFVGMAQGAAGVATAYLSVGAVIDKLNASIDTLAELDDMAQKTGSSVENLSRLQKVAAMTGAEFGKVDSALIKLAKGMAAVDDDTNKTNKALAALGLTSKDAAGQLRDPSEVMADLAKKLQGYEDGAAKAALATDLFGKSGADLLPYLNDVAENVDQFAGVSSQAAKQASELQDKMGLMRVRASELFTSVAVDLVPSVIDFIDALNDTKSAGASLYEDGSLSSWADDTLVGVARLIDVLKVVPALARAIGASFEVVWADIQFLAKAFLELQIPSVIARVATGGNALGDVNAYLEERNQIVADANKKYDVLWNTPANGLESAVMRRIAARTGENLDARDLKLKALQAGAAQADSANKETLNYSTGNAAQNAGIKEKTSAYDALIKSIHEKIAASELELSGYAQLSESQKETIKLNELVAIAKKKGQSLNVDEARAQIQILSANERINDENKFYIEQAKAKADASNALIKTTETEAAKQEELARTFGLSKSAIEQLDIARLEEQLSQKGGIEACTAETVALAALIDAKKRNALASASFEQQDAAKKTHEGMNAEWKKSVEQYDDVFRKGFADMVNGGQATWSSFTKSLVTTFKTSVADQIYKMLAQPFVVKMVGSMMGMFSNGSGVSDAMGAASSGKSMIGDGASLLSSGKTLWDGFSAASSIGGGIGSMVGGAVGSVGSLFGSSAISAFGSGLAGTATGTFAGAGMTAAGSATGMGALAGSSAAGAGSAITAGLAAIPVWGWIALAGIAAAKFGGGKDRVGTGSTVSGNLGSNEIYKNDSWTKDGGWFNSNTSGVWNRNLSTSNTVAGGRNYGQTAEVMASDKALLSSLNLGYGAIKAASADYAKALGINADSIASRTDTMSFAIGKDAAETQSNIAKMYADISEKIATDLLGSFVNLKKESESTSATMARLSGGIATANSWLSLLKQRLFQVSLSGAAAASKLADAFGGLQNMTSASQAFYDLYYTDGERAVNSTKAISAALKQINVVMPATKEQFRTITESLDLTTESGRTAYAALLTLAPEFANAAALISTLSKETASKLIEAFTGKGQLIPALKASSLSTDQYIESISGTGAAAGSISTLFLDATSKLLNFGGGTKELTSLLSGAQLSAQMLTNEIDDLKSSTDKTKIDIAGLSAALVGVSTETFINTVGIVFENLSTRIKAVIDSIGAERIAVRDAAMQIINPTVMSKDAILRSIGTINTTLPSNSGVVHAQKDLAVQDGTVDWHRTQLAGLENLLPIYKTTFYSQAGDSLIYWAKMVDGLEKQIAEKKIALNDATVAQSASMQQAKMAQLAYANAMQNFTIDASKSVSKLTNLRAETMKYYDAQKQLADLMKNSAAGLRGTVAEYKYNQLTPEQQFADLQAKYSSAYSMALSTDGSALAGYGDKLNGMLGPLLEKAKEIYGSGSAYDAFVATTLARADNIAGRLETLTPKNYAADSLAMLGQIDATLMALDSASKSAEKIISDAIKAGSDRTAAGLHAVIAAITGQSIPGFVNGGDFGGGLRIVGENGPELEATGAARIFTASQTRTMLSGGGNTSNADVVAELRGLRQDNANMRAELQAIAISNAKLARLADKDRLEGVLVRTEADAPLVTVAA